MDKKQGNLIDLALQGHFGVIAHGCNCFHVMGAGIAKAVKETFPEAWAADKATKKGDRNKLGSLSSATIHLPEKSAESAKSVTVANLYTQLRWGPASPAAGETQESRYDAIRKALTGLRKLAAGRPTGLPRIGAGLAGGDWKIISEIIGEVFPEATVVELPAQPHKEQRPPGGQELSPA